MDVAEDNEVVVVEGCEMVVVEECLRDMMIYVVEYLGN